LIFNFAVEQLHVQINFLSKSGIKFNGWGDLVFTLRFRRPLEGLIVFGETRFAFSYYQNSFDTLTNGSSSIVDNEDAPLIVACVATSLSDLSSCDLGGASPASLDLTWNSPAISGTSTFPVTGFTSWLVYATGLETGKIYDLRVDYGLTSSTLIYSDSYSYSWSYSATSSIIGIPLNTSLTPPDNATSSVWFASAWIQERGTETKVFAGIVAFTITKDQANYTYFATSTAPELFGIPTLTSEETSSIGILERFGLWLFVPSTSTAESFRNTLSGQCDFEGNHCTGGLLQDFPFSLIFDFSNTLQNLSSEVMTDRTLTYSVPGVPNVSLDFLSSSTLSSVFGQENKDMIFEVQKNAFWFATGLFIIASIL